MVNPNTSSLREHLLQKRTAESLDAKKFKALEVGLNTQILSFLEALELKKPKFIQSIAFYYPIKGEPDISSALITWANNKKDRILGIPVTKVNEPLSFAQWNKNCELTQGLYKIPEPANPQFFNPDLIIAPCLGWIRLNNALWRIGYGAGFYDRTLDHLRKSENRPLFIGIGFNCLEVTENEWTPKSHDVPMDALITETSIHQNISK